MIILIGGASCVGKTKLAHELMIKANIPYLSIDQLKMGLVRSNNSKGLTQLDSENKLIELLWPILVGIIKTDIENNQDLIIEGSYIPKNALSYFNDKYQNKIKVIFLAFSNDYINNNYISIVNNSSCIEKKEELEYLTKEYLIKENTKVINECRNISKCFIINNDYLKEVNNIIEYLYNIIKNSEEKICI